jgi:tetratricopeptide (TPR) repeat protein
VQRRLLLLFPLLAACARFNERNAPDVERARVQYEAGVADAASAILGTYLKACPAYDSGTETPRPQATFDYGLVLFQLLETYGGKIGGAQPDPASASEAACALRVLDGLLADTTLAPEERLEALYLRGNLLFLLGKRAEAIASYDSALELGGGASEKGLAVLRYTAYNRALALGDPPPDGGADGAPPDSAPPDASNDAANDAGDGGGEDGGADASSNDGGADSGKSDGGKEDAGDKSDGGDKDQGDAGNASDGGDDQDASSPDTDTPDAGADAAPSELIDERILEQLDKTPSLQREIARRNQKRIKPLEDK